VILVNVVFQNALPAWICQVFLTKCPAMLTRAVQELLAVWTYQNYRAAWSLY